MQMSQRSKKHMAQPAIEHMTSLQISHCATRLTCDTTTSYRNFPKFSDRQVWANSADPDQTAPRGAVSRSSLIWVCTVCHSVCIVWTHYSMVEPHSSNFRVITINFLGVRIFRRFTVLLMTVPIAGILKVLYWDETTCILSYKFKRPKNLL